MKYLKQAVIIAAVTAAAEGIKYVVPLPVPASIYGLILLFGLLKGGVLRLEEVEDVGGLLLVPASVSFLTAADTIGEMLAPVLIMGFIGTAAVMAVTGRVAQAGIRRGKGDGKHG